MSRCWPGLVVWLIAAIGCAAPRTTDCDTSEDAGPAFARCWANRHKDLDSAEREKVAEEMAKKWAEENGKDEKNGNGEEHGNGEKKNGNGGFQAKHIRDNGFLIEEAFNQGIGEVQHIFNWIQSWDRAPRLRSRFFDASYGMELPLGSQLHQFSFTVLYQTVFEKTDDGLVNQVGDIGDTELSYRYQLFANDDTLWCAPKFALILPTGDERFGFSNGAVGYDFVLPVSFYRDRFDFHINLGYSITPNASVELPNRVKSPRHDLNGYLLGAALYWKPEVFLHFFIEALWLRNEGIIEDGSKERGTQVFLNPGFRYAVTQNEGVEWVLGVAVPVGLTRDTPDIGVFAYMSIEYDFRNPKKNGNGGH
jgi:hypothetical protein